MQNTVFVGIIGNNLMRSVCNDQPTSLPSEKSKDLEISEIKNPHRTFLSKSGSMI